MYTIHNPGKYFSKAFCQGDVAVVTINPTVSNNLINWLEEQGALGRISGIFHIMAEMQEKQSTAELRAGWARVLREIRAFAPNTKRILAMIDTKTLYIIAPVLKKSVATLDLDAVHGTLFTLDEFIFVPTEVHNDYKHTEQWRNRDLARCLKLTKPEEPLSYHTKLPRRVGPDLVVDFETSGLDATTDHITTAGVQWSDTGRALVSGEEFMAWIMDQDVDNLIMHNAQFDLGFTSPEFREKFYGKIRDTIVIARARGELIASLKHLGNVYTARPGNYAWLDLSSSDPHAFDDPSYVCEDLDVTWRLWKLWSADAAKPVVELMDRAVVMACEQTLSGSFLDTSRLSTLASDGAALVVQMRDQLTAKYGVDPGQTDLLVAKLRDMGYVFSKQTKTGKDSLTAEVLEELGLLDILEFRKAMKLDSAFVGKLQDLLRENGTLPHRQTLLGARTGRTTMTEFNWQQMPKKGPGKTLLISRWPGGFIFNCDLKSAEVFTACYISLDRKLAKALMGPDMHKANAARGFNIAFEDVNDDQRFQAKALIFRSIFGGGPTNETQKRVHEYMTREFNELFRWIDSQKRKGQNNLRVEDVLGKVTNMLDKFDYAGKWACGRLGINAPVQGTSSHIAIAITLRVWELFRACGLRSLVLFGVHDSLVCDIHPDEKQSAIACMLQAFRDVGQWVAQWLPMIKELPMLGELTIGSSWADCKKSEVTWCSTAPIIEGAPF